MVSDDASFVYNMKPYFDVPENRKSQESHCSAESAEGCGSANTIYNPRYEWPSSIVGTLPYGCSVGSMSETPRNTSAAEFGTAVREGKPESSFLNAGSLDHQQTSYIASARIQPLSNDFQSVPFTGLPVDVSPWDDCSANEPLYYQPPSNCDGSTGNLFPLDSLGNSMYPHL